MTVLAVREAEGRTCEVCPEPAKWEGCWVYPVQFRCFCAKHSMPVLARMAANPAFQKSPSFWERMALKQGTVE